MNEVAVDAKAIGGGRVCGGGRVVSVHTAMSRAGMAILFVPTPDGMPMPSNIMVRAVTGPFCIEKKGIVDS